MNENIISNSFYVYYKLMDFSEKNPKSSIKTLEEKTRTYAAAKEAFLALFSVSSGLNPKIIFDDENRKILCGYKDKKEFKAAFPESKKYISISSLRESQKIGIPVIASFFSEEFLEVIQRENDEENERVAAEQRQFQIKMEEFYKTHSFPPRSLFKFPPTDSLMTLALRMLSHYSGFGIGDGHSEISPLLFLTENMEEFKAQGVTTIFTEHYPEQVHREVLKYFDPQNPLQKFPKKLAQTLMMQTDQLFYKTINDKRNLDIKPKLEAIFFEFFKAMKKHGIEYRSIETRELYEEPEELPRYDPQDAEELGNPYGAKWRIKPMNYTAAKLLRQFQKKRPHEKFIYHTGYFHNSTYGKMRVPGISDMTNTPWILFSEGNEEALFSGDSEQGKNLILEKKAYSHNDPQFAVRPDAIALCNF